MSILFSQASIFHLYRLGLVVSGKTGHKYSLSDETQRLDLIRYCDASHDQSIQRQLNAFLSTLEPELLQTLEIYQLIRPRSVHIESAKLKQRFIKAKAG